MDAQKVVDEWYVKQQQRMFTIKDKIIVGNPPSKKMENDSIAKIILDSLSKDPDFVCQINVQTGEKITFTEMKNLSIRCALWLKKQGIGKHDVVATAVPNQTDDYVPCLATFYINAIYNPWNLALTPATARRFFKTLQPKIMFAYEQSIDMFAQVAKDVGSICKFVVYGKHEKYPSFRDLLLQQSQEEVENFHHVEPEEPKKDVAVILFSSGTTGIPKGTMLSYDSMVNNRIEYSLVRKNTNNLWYSSMCWITGTNYLLSAIRMHTTRILHSEFDPEETSKVIEKYKVKWAFFTPGMLTRLVKAKVFSRYDYSSIEVILNSGAKANKSILEEIRKALPHAIVSSKFGMTELGGMTVRQTRDSKSADSLGQVIEGIKMKVIDSQTGQLLGSNQLGELCFKLDYSMLGYFKNPEANKEVLDDEGWVHSGDLGYYDVDGEIWITDRIKQVIYSQDNFISPSQIEEILVRHPDVADAAVVGVPHEFDIERPFAFIVRVPGAKVSAEELKELPAICNESVRLSGGVVFVDELPYTATGKKSLKTLKEIAKTYVQ